MENYEKMRVVGRGAYGTVHLCKRISDKKLVIIKQIPVEQMTKDERQAALTEVRVLSMLNHPFIIEYYENFLEDKALMIVMEYAQGGTMFEYLQQRNGNLLEEDEVLYFLAQMVLAIQHVHSKQILHRDLKTQNILLDKKKQTIKISDFGISKVLSSKSKAYTVVGTPCYISPELCEGKPYNQKSDIWALGCVFYELVTLKRAFEAANLPALVLKIMRGTFSPISDVYSEHLQALIMSTLHLEPSKRPHINQIMATPVLINSIMSLYTDLGKIPCTRTQRLKSNVSSKGNLSTHVGSHTSKPNCLSLVYYWGGDVTWPAKLPLPSPDTEVVQVASGRTHKCAVTKSGRVILWETSGASFTASSEASDICQSFVPRYLEGQSAVAIVRVSCGDLFTACLTNRGILMTFGSGSTGCLGHGNHSDVYQAKIVEDLLGYEVIQISCGSSHVMALTNEHEVFAWGRGDNGRLGLGSYDSSLSPTLLSIPANHKPYIIVCGFDCSMLITEENRLLCCGSNRYNKLALDRITTESSEPQETVNESCSLKLVESEPMVDLLVQNAALGISHSVIITVDGQCYTCGSNQFGQLGIVTKPKSRLPRHLECLSTEHVVSAACGDAFSVAVTNEGNIYSWGKSSRGRLGRSESDSNLPQRVSLPSAESFVPISLTCSHGNTLFAIRPCQAASGS